MYRLIFLCLLIVGVNQTFCQTKEQKNSSRADSGIQVYCQKMNTEPKIKVYWYTYSNIPAKTYCVYCAVDDGEYLLWTPDTKATEVIYNAPKGHNYKFMITARGLDNKWGGENTTVVYYNK